MTPVRIIGLGSPHGTDRIGWEVIERFTQTGSQYKLASKDISYHCCAGPHELPALLEHCGLAILLDAAELPAGEIREVSMDQLVSTPRPVSAHAVNLVTILGLIDILPNPPQRIRCLALGSGTTLDAVNLDSLAMRLNTVIAEMVHRSG